MTFRKVNLKTLRLLFKRVPGNFENLVELIFNFDIYVPDLYHF